MIEQLQKRIAVEERELRASALGEVILFGEGKLTHSLLRRELLDLQRFKNARRLSNYLGLCPSESTSGDKRHLGPITKHGNPRLRKMMIELAWRSVDWQPQYIALRRWGPVLSKETCRSPGARKKAIVALARRLAVDLWRISIGRKTAEELGLRLATA